MVNKWVFRVSSKPSVGGGHVLRCVSIALALRHEADVIFLLDQDSEQWVSYLDKKMLASTTNINDIGVDVKGVLVDGYDFSDDYLKYLRRKYRFLVVLDDVMRCDKFADLIISPGVNCSTDYCNTSYLCGSEYFIISDDYINHDGEYIFNSKVDYILITLGYSADSDSYFRVLELLDSVGYTGKVVIASGEFSNNRPSSYSFRLEYIVGMVGLAKLVYNADLIIGAAGTSLIERIYVGCPSMTFILAENQRVNGEWASKLGVTMVFDIDEDKDILINCLTLLLYSEKIRKNMYKNSIGSIDGNGANRIATYMHNKVSAFT